MEFITESAGQTQKLGEKIADSIKDGGIFALSGNLGSGKTTFVQGFAKGFGIKQRIISPTFILLRKYQIPALSAGRLDTRYQIPDTFYHIDLYRLEENIEEEVKNLGVEDIWKDPKNIVIIEWAEKIKNFIPKEAKWIKFENLGGEKRKITIK